MNLVKWSPNLSPSFCSIFMRKILRLGKRGIMPVAKTNERYYREILMIENKIITVKALSYRLMEQVLNFIVIKDWRWQIA